MSAQLAILWRSVTNRPCMFVCGSVTTITRIIACIDPHQTGFVGEGCRHLQLIKFWPSFTPGKGACGGAKYLAPLYYSQSAVFASPPSAFSCCNCPRCFDISGWASGRASSPWKYCSSNQRRSCLEGL